MPGFRWIVTPLCILWASPGTLLGLTVGLASLPWRGRMQRVGRVLEFWGPPIAWVLLHLPPLRGAAAVTFGHVVLGRSLADLNRTRAHELVHVRQYERWGPFFIPAYLLCWLVLRIRGRDGYWDNPFEVEAYEKAP